MATGLVLVAGTGAQSTVAAEVGTEIGVDVELVATGGGAVARVPELAVVEAVLADIERRARCVVLLPMLTP